MPRFDLLAIQACAAGSQACATGVVLNTQNPIVDPDFFFMIAP